MKQTWIGLALALALMGTLTACGDRDQNGAGSVSGGANQNGTGSVSGSGAMDGTGSGSTAGSGAMNGAGSGSTAGSGAMNGAGSGSMAGSGSGAAGGSVNGNSAVGDGSAAGASGAYTGRTSYQKRLPDQRGGANPFLQDGRYRANDNGQVDGRTDSAARDFTQDARDILRGAGEAVGDVGRGIQNAAQ